MKLKRLNFLFLNPPNGIPAGCCSSNEQQEVDDVNLYQVFNEPETPVVIMLESCHINSMSLLNVCQKTKELKNI